MSKTIHIAHRRAGKSILFKKEGMALLQAHREETEKFQKDFSEHMEQIEEKKHGKTKQWECPICAINLIVQGLATLYCNNCNEYYTVSQYGELERIERP